MILLNQARHFESAQRDMPEARNTQFYQELLSAPQKEEETP